MFCCTVCGSKDSQVELVSEVFNLQGQFYLVEEIPATVCSRCGEESFSRETTEGIRVMLQGEKQPVRSIAMDVFAFPAEPKGA